MQAPTLWVTVWISSDSAWYMYRSLCNDECLSGLIVSFIFSWSLSLLNVLRWIWTFANLKVAEVEEDHTVTNIYFWTQTSSFAGTFYTTLYRYSLMNMLFCFLTFKTCSVFVLFFLDSSMCALRCRYVNGVCKFWNSEEFAGNVNFWIFQTFFISLQY